MKRQMNKFAPLLMAAAVATSTLPFSQVQAEQTSPNVDTAEYYAVNMKISYNDFYKLYGVDTKKGVTSADYVDAVTSATKGKPAMNQAGQLNQGTYYTSNADGSLQYIEGVDLPVIVTKADKEALVKAGAYEAVDFKAADSKGTIVNVTQSAILAATIKDASKVVSANAISADTVSISKIAKDPTKVTDAKVTLSTTSNWGDYELDFQGDLFTQTLAMNNNVIYGAIVNTVEGGAYPMYAQENLWRNFEIAWSVGVKTLAKNCPLRSEIYKASNGQTVSDVTFITSAGIYNVDFDDLYLPIKNNATVSVADTAVADSLEIKPEYKDLPADFVPSFSLRKTVGRSAEPVTSIVSNEASVTVNTVTPGAYKLTVTDAKGKYAPLTASFNVKGSKVVLENQTLVMDKKGADSLANYVSEISSVDVTDANGVVTTYYTANQSKDFKMATIFNTDGSVNLSAKYEDMQVTGAGREQKVTATGVSGNVFATGSYTIAVKTTNYDLVTGSVIVANVLPTESPAPTTEPTSTVAPTTAPTEEPTTSPVVTEPPAPTKTPANQTKKTLKVTVTAKKNAKKVVVKTTKGASITIKVAGKTYKATAKKASTTIKLKKKLKKGTKLVVKVTLKGYKTYSKTVKAK